MDWNGVKIGEGLMTLGYLEKRHLDIVLLRQESGDSRRFGEIAKSLNYVTEDQIQAYLEIKNKINKI